MRKDEIVWTWLGRVRSVILPARREFERVLEDTVPEFLDELAVKRAKASAASESADGVTDRFETPLLHGMERAIQTNDSFGQVIQELQIFRLLVLEILDGERTIGPRLRDVVIRMTDGAIREAPDGFELAQQQHRTRIIRILGHDMRNPLSVGCRNRVVQRPQRRFKIWSDSGGRIMLNGALRGPTIPGTET